MITDLPTRPPFLERVLRRAVRLTLRALLPDRLGLLLLTWFLRRRTGARR